MPQTLELLLFKLGHSYSMPTLTDLPQSSKDQFQTTLLGHKSWDHLGAPLLLSKSAFQQVGGSNSFVMDRWISKVRPTSFQVLTERLHRRWIKLLVSLKHICSDHFCNLSVRGSVRSYLSPPSLLHEHFPELYRPRFAPCESDSAGAGFWTRFHLPHGSTLVHRRS